MNDYRSITAVFRDGRKRTYRGSTRPRQFYRCAEDYAIESGKAGAEQYGCVDCNITEPTSAVTVSASTADAPPPATVEASPTQGLHGQRRAHRADAGADASRWPREAPGDPCQVRDSRDNGGLEPADYGKVIAECAASLSSFEYMAPGAAAPSAAQGVRPLAADGAWTSRRGRWDRALPRSMDSVHGRLHAAAAPLLAR